MHYFSNFICLEIILLLAHSHLLAQKSVLVTMGNQLYLNSETLATNLGPEICDSFLIAVKTLLVNPGLLEDIFHQQYFNDEVGAGIDGCSCANCMKASYSTQLMRFGNICYLVDQSQNQCLPYLMHYDFI